MVLRSGSMNAIRNSEVTRSRAAGHQAFIRNPLTVVGMFAGVAEVSGVWVLPRLSLDLQGAFIWFVMLFPALLVLAFFLTLNFNPKCLYAPGDFRDDAAFIDTIGGTRQQTAMDIRARQRTAKEAVAVADQDEASAI
jgi:hypothetical protein